jgi:hypothetical protein
MKKLLTILLMILAMSPGFAGKVTQIYTFDHYSIEEAGGFQLIRFEGCMNTGLIGDPSMPWYAVKLLLPPGETALSYTITLQGKTEIPGNYSIYPQQASRPLSHGGSGSFIKNNEVYESPGLYPAEASGSISTHYMNGHGIALLHICPLVYEPSEGRLAFYREITVSLITGPGEDSENTLSMIGGGPALRQKLENFVDNPAMIGRYPVQQTRSDDYQLLIITPQAFEGNFGNLCALYLDRGIRSEIASTEDISTLMSGQDLQEKIRNYIIQEYQNNNIEYVLLGGDVEHVPYRGFYCYVQSGAGYSDNNIPADLYYSALDGTWNDNGNNLWGEIGEDDLFPEVAIGRYTFSNTTELNAMLNKTISYQESPVLGEFTNPLLAGEHLWNDPLTWGSDYMRLLVGYRDDNGYTTIGIPPEHDIDTLYERYQSWGGSTIMAEINNGKSFVHHCGHANAYTVMHLNISDITNANFSQVNGLTHNYTFVHSHGCICGAFDYSDCIMEHMLFIDNFAAAVIGNSRYGWFNEGQTEGPAAHLHREMVDAMYEEEIGRIGAAFVECKIQTAPWVTAPGQHEEGALRWNFYDINILGDPVLQVWTDEPFTVNAVFQAPIQVGDTSMDVTVYSSGTPVAGMMCALTKDGTLHGTGITDANGEATIVFDPPVSTVGTAKLTISGYNCLTTSYNIVVSPAAGAFMIYHDHILDDTAGGNANTLPDYGESILMTILLANAGTADATNVTAELNSSDQYITITDNAGVYGTVPAGTLAGTTNDYAFDVAEFVPDQHVVDFNLSISGEGKENWNGAFSIVLNAPVLEAGQMIIDDIANGNGDGFLDPGETAIIRIAVMNTGHSDAPGTVASLNTGNSWISQVNTTYVLDTLIPWVNAFAEFELSADENTPHGTTVVFDFSVESGVYTDTKEYTTIVGMMVEDWESGGFNTFNWQFAGNAPWTICTVEPYEGIYCVRSGEIGDNQSSELFLTAEVLAAGDLSFYRKLSSEAEWDFLRFYIDNNLAGEWSGELDWEMVSFPVTQGLHTFSWKYEKDTYLSSGEDCAWVDYIVFPPIDISTGIAAGRTPYKFEMTIRPNPATESTYIEFSLGTASRLITEILDMQGRTLMTNSYEKIFPQGRHVIRLDLAGLSPGIYLCRIITHAGQESRKLVIK